MTRFPLLFFVALVACDGQVDDPPASTPSGPPTPTASSSATPTASPTPDATPTPAEAGSHGWASLDGHGYALEGPPFGAACGLLGDVFTVSVSADGPDPSPFAKGSMALHFSTPAPELIAYTTVVDWVGGSSTETGFLFQDDQFQFWEAQDGAGTVQVDAVDPLRASWTDLPVTANDASGTVVLTSGEVWCP